MRELATPRWITAHIVVVVIAVVFVNLGFWQLRRLDDVQLENAVAESRYTAPPQDLGDLLRAVGDDLESLRYRRVTLSGEYDAAQEVLTRNQVFRGNAGFHVVTPFIPEDGRDVVLINRGWVPLELDSPPISQAPPPMGMATIGGWLHLSQARPALGPTDPVESSTNVFSRVDIQLLQGQMPYQLAPVYVVLQDENSQGVPVALAPPEFDDEGPHLAYAIQWFGFTIVGLIGYWFLIRKNLSTRK